MDELKCKTEMDLSNCGYNDDLTYQTISTHEGVKGRLLNEIISCYKQTIWQTRGAIYSRGRGFDIVKEMREAYEWKITMVRRDTRN